MPLSLCTDIHLGVHSAEITDISLDWHHWEERLDPQALCNLIRATGVTVPCDSAFFLAILLIHVPSGLVCVVTGLVATFSRKGMGRHPNFGTIYYRFLTVVFITASALSAMRWTEDWYLFVLGGLSFAAALLGRTAHQQRWRNWIQLHITGMSFSYVLLLTAFYVDNGKNLPIWKDFSPIVYWVLPSAIGIPLIIRALLTHPLVLSQREAARTAD